MYQGFTELIVEKQDKILVIKFYNPKKKNSVNRTAYKEIGLALRQVANDESVTVVVFTGVGEFFTSGNDLSQSSNDMTDLEAYIIEANKVFKEMVSSVIDCPKLVVALVNGPCIGIGATLAGLSDLTWCSDTAYFLTPFTKLAIVPEACSTYLFPLLMGRSKATEMLLLGEKMSAEEAFHFNFVSKIYKNSEVDAKIWPKLRDYSELPPTSLRISKQLMRMHEKKALYTALDEECDYLSKCINSDEFVNALMQFAMRKRTSKL